MTNLMTFIGDIKLKSKPWITYIIYNASVED